MDRINKKEMEQVQGGGTTRLRCSNCGAEMIWKGYYLDQTFDCSKCGQHTFTGIEYHQGAPIE